MTATEKLDQILFHTFVDKPFIIGDGNNGHNLKLFKEIAEYLITKDDDLLDEDPHLIITLTTGKVIKTNPGIVTYKLDMIDITIKNTHWEDPKKSTTLYINKTDIETIQFTIHNH